MKVQEILLYLKELKNIYNLKIYNSYFKVKAIINYKILPKFEYKSSENNNNEGRKNQNIKK